MRLLILSIAIVSFVVSCKTNHKRAEKEVSLTEAEVKNFIRKYDDMWGRRDTGMMKLAIDERYTYFTSTGAMRNRNDILSWFTPTDKYKVEKAERSEISIQLIGNTAIVSSRWIGNGSFGNEKFSDDQRCGLTIQKINGELKLLSEHCTQIAGNEAN